MGAASLARLYRAAGAVAILAAMAVGGCGTTRAVPPCPFRGEPDAAISAGCLVQVHGKILVVVSSKGGVTPPGGKTREGESAQCAAHRETWEETGLNLMPGQLIHVFDTGFHLYHCEIHSGSGGVELGSLREVRGWRWLAIEDFDQVEWRYPGQGEALRRLLTQNE